MLAFMKLAVGMRGFFDVCRSRRHAETDCSDDLALSAQCVLDSRFHLHFSPASDKNESARARVVHLSEETHHRFSVKYVLFMSIRALMQIDRLPSSSSSDVSVYDDELPVRISCLGAVYFARLRRSLFTSCSVTFEAERDQIDVKRGRQRTSTTRGHGCISSSREVKNILCSFGGDGDSLETCIFEYIL